LHPLISLLSFIVFAAFVSLGQTASSAAGFLLLMLVWLVSRQLPELKAWLMIKRLRIFFLSIFIMYFWFTPGQLVWPLLDRWSPTYDGLAQGMERILALIILVLGVESLLRLMSRSELLVGLFYLATPLLRFGINRERFIVRVLLTLEAVNVQPSLDSNNHRFEMRQFKVRQISQYLAKISEMLAARFSLAENQSLNIEELVVEIKSPPGWIQWLIPLALFIIFMNLNLYL